VLPLLSDPDSSRAAWNLRMEWDPLCTLSVTENPVGERQVSRNVVVQDMMT
jgi:hypothetical protein